MSRSGLLQGVRLRKDAAAMRDRVAWEAVHAYFVAVFRGDARPYEAIPRDEGNGHRWAPDVMLLACALPAAHLLCCVDCGVIRPWHGLCSSPCPGKVSIGLRIACQPQSRLEVPS